MDEIVLEECFNEKGKYLGKIVIREACLTPEFVDKIKADKKDEMGWKKYHQKLKDKGYDID